MPSPATRRILRRVLTISCWAVLGAAAAAGLARYLELTSVSLVAVVAIAPWGLLPAAVAVGGLALSSGWRSAVAGGLVLALIGWPQVATYLPAGTPAAAPVISVLTANTLHGRADPDALVATVRERDVDVLAVQELTPQSIDRLTAAGLDEVLPYHRIAVQQGGTDVGLYSRHPLAQSRLPTGFAFTPVQATVVDGGQEVTVIAFHSSAPLSAAGTARWQSDLDRLAEVMAGAAGPTIVAGDFNATRDHRQFRDLLDTGFTDAGSDAGAGILPTWPADRFHGPVIGIDHVLVSSDLVGVAVESLPQPGSDHLAVLASIAPSTVTGRTGSDADPPTVAAR